jgi:rhamnulokinase
LGEPESLAIDTWGCDFGLLDSHGELAGNPYHYRDEGSLGAMADVLRIIPREEIFRRTGCQFMPVNTLYQLFAMRRAGSTALERAETLLMIPDLLRYLLTGERTSEYTNATTTQFLAIDSGDWDRELLRRLDLPAELLTAIVPPASVGGDLLPGAAAETGGDPIRGVGGGSHDTASAVAAAPDEGEFAYLSSGTWSLLGTELGRPIVDARALAWNFANEGGLAGTYRLLRNIMGLWLVEGCRRIWEREGCWTGYEAMAGATLAATPFLAVIDPDDPRFLNPPDMPGEVAAFCRETGQRVPRTPGEIMRVVLERTERLSGRRFPGLHVVGGGTNNVVLQQFTANAIGRPVWAGPVEATAIGNLLAQFIANGEITDLAEGRALVRASFPLRVYEPAETAAWDEAFARYQTVRAAHAADGMKA